ncbi:CPBP family intramembrane glutamic endopeptidase [Aeromicrobium wangtongii]|uniref:CPBP family intramembrane glutamic endopeptidase n=1 Tax=Aeromicrobium wangtongii TaxID=2969247 RepID=UPI002018079C|nr:type II CAAX endopeptidase family protein [Aeromicrobium wangtongii]MCL3817203.1 CPBP family intramembrane metalloprotease [Aeromicrobium wangtongii]
MATPYHRLARETPAYAWWKLPLAGLLAAVAYAGLTIALVVAGAAWFALTDSGNGLDDWLDAAGDLDLEHLDFFVLDMLGLVLLIPAIFIGVAVVGPRPVGYLSSVAGRLRWRWMGLMALLSSIVFIVTIGASLVVDELTDPTSVSGASSVDGRVVAALVAIVLIVPFQAAAEEYVFRGYLMQLFGSWSRFAAVPVILTTPLFVAGHLYGLWGLLDVGLFGLTAAVLTIRTGGLEAAIAAHAANNIVLFVLDALGMIAATDDSDAGPTDLIPTVVSGILILVLVEWAARRSGLQRTREPIPDPPAPQAPMWPPPPYAMLWYPPAGYAPPPAAAEPPRVLHPDTPDYPGELPEGWNS